ncbi:hypothetical protein F5B22DRAFT_491597 [Xylaria bambusicola]|uniref:uncharacterized protein n=1 Tax=Xylaria bambusicola TaxID=326684 RepID=UPI002007D103|nr:uncharacterized protein F5B22DRAFT_491597 [Xylaria bambusicola]KAI0505791.1 hypothetical protein F5B22DRAFT_491597 [Xylaria bambusicola]
MMLIKPSNIIRLSLVTRRHIATSGTTSIRPLLRLTTRPLLLPRFKTTSAKTEGPQTDPGPLLRPNHCIYHAGALKITFLGWLKLTSLFLCAFFGFVVTPACYNKEGLSPTVARIAFCAVAPVVVVAYITSPFVTFIRVRLPPFARQSTEAARRYLQNSTSNPVLEITTMSFIAKPRTSVVRISDLVPVNKRFGLVNIARDTAADNAARKWYMFRAVGNFHVPSQNNSERWLWRSTWDNELARRQHCH